MSSTAEGGVENATLATSNSTTINGMTSSEETVEELFPILYRSMLFLLLLYVTGDILCGKLIRIVPPLVGQIAIGMVLGPHVLQFVPDLGWPYLGEIGLILLLCQAGLEMDFEVLLSSCSRLLWILASNCRK